MRQREVFPCYRKCAEDMEKIYEVIKQNYDVEKSVDELMQLRGYVGDDQRELLTELQVCSCSLFDVGVLGESARNLGFVTKADRFLLDDRFVIPVRDICNNLVTLVGYYPDSKKYITVPTPFFSKESMLFNIDDAFRRSYAEYDGVVFLVEGMFDCLSLRAIGLPAVATMGSDVTVAKRELLKLFRKVIYIPDNDKVGRRALNRYDERFGWKVPDSATGIKLAGEVSFNGKPLKVKDVDNLVSWFDADSVREILLSFANSTELVENLIV